MHIISLAGPFADSPQSCLVLDEVPEHNPGPSSTFGLLGLLSLVAATLTAELQSHVGGISIHGVGSECWAQGWASREWGWLGWRKGCEGEDPSSAYRMAPVRSMSPEQPVGNRRAIVVAPGRTLCGRCAGNPARRQRGQTGDLRMCTDRCTGWSLAQALPWWVCGWLLLSLCVPWRALQSGCSRGKHLLKGGWEEGGRKRESKRTIE